MPAPKGNTNALKHGLYAKHFSPQEHAGLRNMTPEDYRHEINMLRISITRLFEIQTRLHDNLQGPLGEDQSSDIDAFAKISNSLSLAITALSSLARTYALFHGVDSSVQDALATALNRMTIFIDDKFLIESHSDLEDQQEVLVE